MYNWQLGTLYDSPLLALHVHIEMKGRNGTLNWIVSYTKIHIY